MESVFSFIGLSLGRDHESAPPSEAETYPGQLVERAGMINEYAHEPLETF